MLPCGVIHLCLYLCQFSTRLWGQGSGSESSCSSGGVSKNSLLVKRLQVRWLIGCKEKLQGERLLAPWPFTVSLFSLGRVPTTPVNPQRILLTFWLDPTVRSLPAGRRGAGGDFRSRSRMPSGARRKPGSGPDRSRRVPRHLSPQWMLLGAPAAAPRRGTRRPGRDGRIGTPRTGRGRTVTPGLREGSRIGGRGPGAGSSGQP